MYKRNENKGITLIALVITIIVLIILASVSIAMLTGDNSILNKATDAKKISAIATVREQVLIAVNTAYTDYLAAEATGVEHKTLVEMIQEELDKIPRNQGEVHYDFENNNSVIITYTKDNTTVIGALNTTTGVFNWINN